jgi:hypothetical protein
MRKTRFLLLVVCAAAAGTGAGASGVRADGLPVLGIDVGGSGIPTPTESTRYVTIPVARGTLVARVARNGGQILGSRFVRGTFTIPAVAYDGTPGGLSADGKRLVLIAPRVSFPRARTGLLLMDAPRLRPLRRVTLDGDFSLDAISPRGLLLYLIEYTSPTDPTRYLVRGLDLRTGRLLPKPIVDPVEPGEKMRGSPITRATGPGGRVAYTLYDGAGATPFVHALDTSRVTAKCIDLDAFRGRGDLWRFHLQLSHDGRTLTVRGRGRAEAIVDTSTYRVRYPLQTTALG